MSSKLDFKIGQIVKNSQTGEVGVVKKVIYSRNKVFGVIVKTRTGRKKWIVKSPKESLWKKIKSLAGF
tara:strand:- start:1201 stop:1404 length:204 start_codon:yes stop_codon:yes gene_type:complete